MENNSVERYISELYGNDDFIKNEEFIKNTSKIPFCPVISTEVARFLKMILEVKKPDRVLELGTSIGYSTTIISQTISKWNGQVSTVEINKDILEVAKKNFVKYDVSNNIEAINDDVFKVLPKIKVKFDLIFLDLFNGLYPDVIDYCIGLLNENGILIADDTLFPVTNMREIFKESNKKIDIFNKVIAKRSDLKSILLPLDDGITVIMKK